ncbi:hypoxanthine phosphoribosyltransferase [Flavobacteriales bacterium]|jgi:hypoxanthine phosphoribosyltransferase|nr:hypoxanthine phosphoribosyltransferase [Flavobacteriales bacterium]
MEKVKIKDKQFVKNIPSGNIQQSIQQVADKINVEMAGKNPVFVVVLNGAFMFASDLLKKIDIECEITFVKVASYEGTSSTGEVKELIGLNQDINNREVIIVEDIVDTGETIVALIDQIKHQDPADVRIATLLFKPDAYRKDIPIDYVAMEVGNDFLVGYGLDYDGLGRNLEDIYIVEETKENALV